MIDPQSLRNALSQGFVPLPGRCVIELDSIPTMAGLLHIPDSARELKEMSHVRGKSVYGDSAWSGKVIAVSPRRNQKTGEFNNEDFQPGDRVWFLLLTEDLNQKIIVTLNTRVYAVQT